MQSTILAISHITLWVLVAVLYIAVFLLYRYLGTRFRGMPDFTNTVDMGPKLGEQINPITMQTTRGTTVQVGASELNTQLLFFAKAGCKACESLAGDFGVLAEKHKSNTETIVLFGGDTDEAQLFEKQITHSVRFVVDQKGQLSKHWGIGISPFVVVLRGDDGSVIFREAVNRIIEIRNAFELGTAQSQSELVGISHVNAKGRTI